MAGVGLDIGREVLGADTGEGGRYGGGDGREGGVAGCEAVAAAEGEVGCCLFCEWRVRIRWKGRSGGWMFEKRGKKKERGGGIWTYIR